MTEAEKSKTTEHFLRLIAQHLSSRVDCKGIEYVVKMGDDVCMCPPKYVYTDRHHRSCADSKPVAEHVLRYHMPEIFIKKSINNMEVLVDKDKIIPGTYKYQMSFDKKKRRWIKIQ